MQLPQSGNPGQGRGGLGFQAGFVQPQSQGQTGQVFPDPGILPAQQGHYLMADPVAQKSAAFVGAVLHMLKAVLPEEVLHLPAGHGEHGPQKPAGDRRDPAQAFQPGAPHQMQEHGLRIVIGGMGRSDLPGKSL